MTLLEYSYWAIGSVTAAIILLFALTSARERRARAAAIATSILLIWTSIWIGWFRLVESEWLLLVLMLPVLLTATLFYLPLRRPRTLRSDPTGERVDERDIMFAREEYLPGTEKYDLYYSMRPDYRQVDDAIRKLPELLQPGAKYYDSVESGRIEAVFRELEQMTADVDGEVNGSGHPADAEANTARIKGRVLELGADAVGIARLNPAFIYSNVGRGPEPWGARIQNNHPFAIAFALEMDYDSVEMAPHLPITAETARKYLSGARISIRLAEEIRGEGYRARAHIAGSNYQIMVPPVAWEAGLGELGRIGYLIHPRLGARLRLGAITTDLPLVPDRPISFGVREFCEVCLKCAINCPSAAIPRGAPQVIRGTEKWPLNVERCLKLWRVLGTDCGLCMKVCPFSHPPTLVHDIIRAGIRNSPVARKLAAWGDDLFYGRREHF